MKIPARSNADSLLDRESVLSRALFHGGTNCLLHVGPTDGIGRPREILENVAKFHADANLLRLDIDPTAAGNCHPRMTLVTVGIAARPRGDVKRPREGSPIPAKTIAGCSNHPQGPREAGGTEAFRRVCRSWSSFHCLSFFLCTLS